MKKLLVVLLALGLIVAFGATASAADLKFSGSYYVTGNYVDNPGAAGSSSQYSKAYFWQRFRLQPVFAIAEGLTFTARIDAMEKKWGQTDWKSDPTKTNTGLGGGVGTVPGYYNFSDETSSRRNNGTNSKVQESMEWERAYVTFLTKAGQFQVGYQAADEWGTTFGDSGTTRPRIMYTTAVGPMILAAVYEKMFEADDSVYKNMYSGTAYANKADADYDTYALFGIFKFKGGEAGMLFKYYNDATGRLSQSAAPSPAYKQSATLLSPYMKGTFGPVYVEAELGYMFGKVKMETAGVSDVDITGWNGYVKGQFNFGPGNVGLQVGYSSGDNGDDATKNKTFIGGCGTSWNPALLLLNDDLNTTGGGSVTNPSGVTNKKLNVLVINAYAGFNPTAKLNLTAALTYAEAADKKWVGTSSTTGARVVTEQADKKLGTEFDVTATYKIFDQLTYMVGAGYLWTGDYFKAANSATELGNSYIVKNQLTLTF